MKKMLFVILVLIMGSFGLVYGQGTKKDGVYKTYFPGGQLETEETYKGGERDGSSKIYDKDGKLVVSAKFKDGELTGAWTAEPEREWGGLKFLFRIEFWAGVLVVGALLWFIWVRVVFKGSKI
jgi:antitoxin component YwqK of YwqJK toxin-antitoxin module